VLVTQSVRRFQDCPGQRLRWFDVMVETQKTGVGADELAWPERTSGKKPPDPPTITKRYIA